FPGGSVWMRGLSVSHVGGKLSTSSAPRGFVKVALLPPRSWLRCRVVLASAFHAGGAMNPVLSTDEVRRCAAALPRVQLAHLPTPLEEAPRFARQLGDVHVWIKRDDCTGLLFGGNKTRHNEFLLAEALKQGADVVVWGAGVQSNNCRQTAAACARLGLECHLFLTRATHSADVQGNLLLDHLMGARV